MPARLIDTRQLSPTTDGQNQAEGLRPAGSTATTNHRSRGVPADAAAQIINVTIASPQSRGYTTIYPCGATTQRIEHQLRRRGQHRQPRDCSARRRRQDLHLHVRRRPPHRRHQRSLPRLTRVVRNMFKRFKPHQLVIAIGIGMAVFTLLSGVVPQFTEWHTTKNRHARGVRGHPRSAAGRVLHGDPGADRVGRVRVRRPRQELGARRSRPAPHDAEERQAPPRATSAPASTCGRCCATPAAGPDALDDLLRLPRAARRHDRARDRPPAAGGPEVPPRPHVPGATRSSATSPASCSWSASSGRSCAATCSGRTASASRPSPSTRSSSACSS